MGRSIGAVIFGVIVASLWIAALEWIIAMIFPVLRELNRDDPEGAARLLAANATTLASVAIAYFIGAFVGGWIGGRTARRRQIVHGLLVGLVMLGIGIVNLLALPHPVWFWIVTTLVFPLAGLLGGWTAGKSQPTGGKGGK